MSGDRNLEREVAEAYLEAAPSREPDRLYDSIITTTSPMRPRPRWLANLKEPPMRHASRVVVGSPTARVAALAAVTLLFAVLGAGALVAGAQSTSPAPPEEEAAPQTPVEFTGHILCGPEVQAGTYEVVPRAGEVPLHAQERDHAWQPVVTAMSEPRMEGTYYLSWNADNFASGVLVGSGTWRIENEEGAWQGSFVKADYPPDYQTTVSSALAGEGAYAGLTAIWESILNPDCTWDVRGVIIEGEPPAVPLAYVGDE